MTRPGWSPCRDQRRLLSVIIVLDEDTPAPARCAGCGGRFRAWGYARVRMVRGRDGTRLLVRPRLLAAADGSGHRAIAAQLDRPAGTVRGWLRRARVNAEAVRVAALEQSGSRPDRLPRSAAATPANRSRLAHRTPRPDTPRPARPAGADGPAGRPPTPPRRARSRSARSPRVGTTQR